MGVPSGYSITVSVAVSCAVWTLLFVLISCQQKHRTYTWNGRMVGFVHGVAISLLTFIFGIFCNPSPFTNPGGASNFYEVLVQIICLGYFLFDTAFCVLLNVYGRETSVTAVHHVLSVAAMVTSLSLGVSGTELSATIFLAECTNPMFQLRWFMRELGLKKTDRRYQLNDFTFVTCFLIARAPISFYLGYCVITHPIPLDIFKIFGLSFCVMNCILVTGMLQFAYHRLVDLLQAWKRADDASREGSDHDNENTDKLFNGSSTFEEITLHSQLTTNILHHLKKVASKMHSAKSN